MVSLLISFKPFWKKWVLSLSIEHIQTFFYLLPTNFATTVAYFSDHDYYVYWGTNACLVIEILRVMLTGYGYNLVLIKTKNKQEKLSWLVAKAHKTLRGSKKSSQAF